MKPDPFDKLFRDADPLSESDGSEDPMLVRAGSQWHGMLQRRRERRRRFTMAIAASVAFFVVAMTWEMHRRGIAKLADRNHDVSESHDHENDPQNGDSLSVEPGEHGSQSDGHKQSAPGDKQSSSAESSSPSQDGERPEPQLAVDPKLELESDRRLIEFLSFVDLAGSKDSGQWAQAVRSLATSPPSAQRLAIELVPQIDDPKQQQDAFDLVISAAGQTRRDVLLRWHQTESLRESAWDELLEDANFDQMVDLMPLAQRPHERNALAVRVAALDDSRTSDLLIQLAGDPIWRPAIKHAVASMNPVHIRSLVLRMRDRDPSIRTAAAFVLALVPGPDVDQTVASFVLGGRFQQPAYMVLLARNTPQAKAFLAHAATRRELSPALVSARVHFANFEEQLQLWIHQTLGVPHVPNETSQSPNDPVGSVGLPDRIVMHWNSGSGRAV